ncbi:MAG: ECF-type sigma factor [Planctomycetota bacterium]
MSDGFLQLVQRLYDGDAMAAEQIVRQHEPEIRRIVRSRLRDPKLRQVLDSIDVCQSVFGKFFLQVSLGRFKLDNPHDLVRLLTRMTTNKIVDKHRHESSQRRLIQNEHKDRHSEQKKIFSVQSETPVESVMYDELLSLAKSKLSEKELVISGLRNQGLSWLEVSRKLDESPQALRKRFERACQRLTLELGLDD